MNALIEQWGARNVGIILLVVAGVMLIIAGLIGWNAVKRGFGIMALDRAQMAAFIDDRLATVAHGREAAEWIPTEPAAGILAIDLTDPAAKDQLARLELRVPMKQRPVVAAINALHQIHHGGKPSGTMGAGDQAVIDHLLKLQKGDNPAALQLPKSDPPQAALLNYATQARFRAAWILSDREAIRTTAGELRLLLPKHPDAVSAEVALLALTPSVANDVVRMRANTLPRGARRDKFLLKLLELAPDREAALRPLVPTPAPEKPATGAEK